VTTTAQVKDGVLVVTSTRPSGMPSDMSLTVSYTMEVPPTLRLDLKSDNGQITAEGTQAGATLESANGEINAKGIKGALSAKSHNGRIEAQEIAADGQEVALASENGEIVFSGTAGTLTGEAGNGRVELKLASVPRSTEVHGGNGEIEVELPKNADADLEAHSGNGQINVEGMSAPGPDSDARDYTARLGAGGSTVRLKTGNGQITVRGS
jgi:DUF4097 and DUF4098 domain-containing protein YvlB